MSGQAEVIAFLSSPSTHGGAEVERIETHASIVFLAGARAWKLKRAVQYDYLDFSTGERRKLLCEAELRINRRAAPALYLGVVAITRQSDGSLRLGGAGNAVDWVIEMIRFDQADLFDRLAASGGLDLGLMRPLAVAIAQFHRSAERRADHGGRAGMAWVIDGNAETFAARGAGVLDESLCRAVGSESRQWLDRRGDLLDRRRDAGFVRQCHGDLHLRNIVLWNGAPTLFDAVEFNDEIACIDVLYDLSFLLMDLGKRELPLHANAIWNGYLAEAETVDLEGVSLMPLFLTCRAAVRAKTSLVAAALQAETERRTRLEELAREYLQLAHDLLRPAAPSLIAIGGFSGTGKSSLAQAMAPRVGAVPGAVVLRSDPMRKRLRGVAELSPLDPEGYRPQVSERVYELLAERAEALLRAGQAVLVDAVFKDVEHRAAIQEVAGRVGVPFAGLWLEAPEEVLLERVRRRVSDASDADASVVRQQLAGSIPAADWNRIDAAGDLDRVLERALSALRPLIEGSPST